jgi:CubicO group peptidase (beta-lactamase class C family)
MAVRKVGMPLADLARGGNEYSRSGVCPRAGENNYPELPISADTLKLIYFFKSVPLDTNETARVIRISTEYTDIANLDDRKESITLEHLLTMTAGFTWDELSIPYVDSEGNPNYENDAVKMGASDDWIQYMLNLSISDEPGAQWTYNSGCTILLSGIIKKKTGQSAEAFAKKNLFTKIGITDWEWEMGPDGIANTGWGLSLYPVDMAMFGYLFLKNGQLNGKQIVPEDWVSESTREHITIIYGYQWWVLPDNMITGHPEANGIFYALGYGGQTIMILPTIDMVIVTTAWNPGQEGFRFDILLDILPAVKEKQS